MSLLCWNDDNNINYVFNHVIIVSPYRYMFLSSRTFHECCRAVVQLQERQRNVPMPLCKGGSYGDSDSQAGINVQEIFYILNTETTLLYQ